MSHHHPPLLVLILASLATGCGAIEETSMCMGVEPEVDSCPAADTVNPDELFSTADCDQVATRVLGEGEMMGSPFMDTGSMMCCYPVRSRDTNPLGLCERPSPAPSLWRP